MDVDPTADPFNSTVDLYRKDTTEDEVEDRYDQRCWRIRAAHPGNTEADEALRDALLGEEERLYKRALARVSAK